MRGSSLVHLLLRLRLSSRAHEICDDLEELFARRAAAHGIRYARRRYWCDVLSLVRPARLRHGFAEPAGAPRATAEGRGRIQSQTREVTPMSALAFDFKQLGRAVSRQPGFFAVASLTLAIGCAAHLSAFTLLDRVLLGAPPHVTEAGSVFRLHIDRADPTGAGRFVWYQTPYPAYRDLHQAEAFSSIAGYRPTVASVGAGADAREIALVYADTAYFSLLGATPQIGRVFEAEENQPPAGSPVVVIADSYWRSAYGADPSVIGRSMKINAATYSIIGVMPRGFTGDTPEKVDAWAPLFAGAHELPAGWATAPLTRAVSVLVRLAPGITTARATEQAATLYRRTVDGTAAADPTALVLLATLQPDAR